VGKNESCILVSAFRILDAYFAVKFPSVPGRITATVRWKAPYAVRTDAAESGWQVGLLRALGIAKLF
jgi:hypothetical protein